VPAADPAPLAFWFFRHAEIPSHRGDLPATEAGLAHAEEVGEGLAAACPAGAHVAFLHAPTMRTVQTAEALRRGIERALPPGSEVRLGAPRVEPAIRNPDHALSPEELDRHAFFSAFVTSPDRIGLWVADDDPPGERADEVAARFFTWARSLGDTERAYARRFVCVTHSGPMRALLRRYVIGEDPGEPDYLEAVELAFDGGGGARWRFRDRVAAGV
jgi:broad specificity phosphatase PhoE